MPLDPQTRVLIDQMAASGLPGLDQMGVDEARAVMRNLAPLAGPVGDDPTVEDITVPGPSASIPVRVYRPRGAGSGAPLLIWLHGGGWVLGDLASADGTARLLSTGAGVVVASVDYPLAPEHPYPAPSEGCHAAARWLAEHAAELGADPGRVAIGGDSAGGNLAAVVALLARDGGGPDLAFQLLVYPCTDALMSFPSMEENAEGYFLTRAAMQWFYGHYLGAAQDVAKEPTVSPLYAEDLAALPPALVITAEFDPLRDEGEAYGRRLQEAGVPTTVSRYDGQIHGFFGLTMVLDAGKRAVREACVALANALGTSAA
jgi:acetyl esterase